jgi:hypothetical protein
MAENKTQKLINLVDRLETNGMALTKQWHDVWDEGMRYFFSDHDKGKRRHLDWDYIIVNYVWPSAMQEIAKLTKNHQKIVVQPWSDDDVEAAEAWQGATQWQWQCGLNMRMNHIAAIFCKKIFGYNVSKVFWKDKIKWDDQKKQWDGDVQYKLWHPALFWADGQENIQDGNCGTVRWMTLDDAKAQWPKYAKKLEEIAVSSSDEDFAKSFGMEKLKTSTSSTGVVVEEDSGEKLDEPNKLLSLIAGSDNLPQDDVKMVRVSETYFRDDEEEHIKQEQDIPGDILIRSGTHRQDELGVIYDNSTNQPLSADNWPKQTVMEYDQPLYPYGRFVISAGQGQKRVILNDKEEAQKWVLDRWPFIVSPHYLLPFMWQGLNAVSLYKTAQDMINISISHLFNTLKQFGDPRIAIEEGAQALNPKTKKPFSISAAAGAVIRLVRGGIGRYKIEPPPQVPPAAMAVYSIMAQEYKNLTGLQGVAQGQQLKSHTTATEAQTLAISSNDRIALQSVYEDEWAKEIATLIARLMQLYYGPDRWVRILGEDKTVGIMQISQGLKDVRYDITVEPGAALPFDEEKRQARYMQAYQLLQSPVANPMLPDMLRVLEIPNAKKILSQYPVYQKYLAFVNLYQQVTSGKMNPQQAVQILIQAAMQEFGSQGGQLPQENNNEG